MFHFTSSPLYFRVEHPIHRTMRGKSAVYEVIHGCSAVAACLLKAPLGVIGPRRPMTMSHNSVRFPSKHVRVNTPSVGKGGVSQLAWPQRQSKLFVVAARARHASSTRREKTDARLFCPLSRYATNAL